MKGGTRRRPPEGYGESDDGVERRPELVADIGQEFRLRPVRRHGLLLGMAEVALGLPSVRYVGQQIDDAAILRPLLADLEDAAIGEAELVVAARLAVARDRGLNPAVTAEPIQGDDATIDPGIEEIVIGEPGRQDVAQLRQQPPERVVAEGQPLVGAPDGKPGADMGDSVAKARVRRLQLGIGAAHGVQQAGEVEPLHAVLRPGEHHLMAKDLVHDWIRSRRSVSDLI